MKPTSFGSYKDWEYLDGRRTLAHTDEDKSRRLRVGKNFRGHFLGLPEA